MQMKFQFIFNFQAIVESAMEEHEEGEGDAEDDHAWKEREAIFKGFTALCGIYFFFMAEKIVGLVSDYRATRKAEQVRVLLVDSLLGSKIFAEIVNCGKFWKISLTCT